jgi:hypothetical protein
MLPEERSRRARIAALTRWSREDPRPAIANARAAWLKRFDDQVDPGRTLPEAERAVRAERALRAHMLSLAHRSAKARRKAAEE